MENPELSDCIICEDAKAEGIRVCDQWICTSCETEMVLTDVKDPKYPFFIRQLKQVGYKTDAL